MGPDREKVAGHVEQVVLNFGCGFNHLLGGINVDAFENCEPDVLWDLNKVPLPWEDNSVDYIVAKHVFEHLKEDCWYGTLCECARILKPGGILEMRVPHESSTSAGTYRDHHVIFSLYSFHGIYGTYGKGLRGRNAWAFDQINIPFEIIHYEIVPHKKYQWLTRWWSGWFLKFAAKHLRNFIWEQAFIFKKMDPEPYAKAMQAYKDEFQEVLEEQRCGKHKIGEKNV